MKDIGKFLKENRIKQKKTIQDISDYTKMNINIIRNIEEGNVAYFSNDLTYLKYYVRSFANAVNVDYDSLADKVEESTFEYTQSMQVLKDEKIKELNENITVKRKQTPPPITHGGIKKVRKSVDWTLVSLISIVTIIVGFLVYSVVINFMDEGKKTETPPVVDVNPPPVDEDEDEEVIVEPEIEPVLVKKEDPNNYLISNWQSQENFSIKTVFGVNTWTQISVNGQVINIPSEDNKSKTYTPNEELVLFDKYKINEEELEFKAGDVIAFRFGIMRNNKIFINNEEYSLDESVANSNGGTDVIFKLDADVN